MHADYPQKLVLFLSHPGVFVRRTAGLVTPPGEIKLTEPV